MSWAKVDDKLFVHPKFLPLSLAARGLWVTALSYAASLERDGWFPDTFLALCGPVETTSQLVNEILSTTLWVREHDGYRFHDYLNYNASQKQLINRRKSDKKRKRGSATDPLGIRAESERIPRGVRADPGSGRDGYSGSVSGSDPESGSGAKPLPGFDAFWIAYPKKRHQPAARRAWEALKGHADYEAIVAGVQRWTASDAWQRGFIEDPATFLRQRQWDDTPKGVGEAPKMTEAERDADLARLHQLFPKRR